jgi:TonB-linked SusC/RagA family outer membrane protein
MLCATQTYAQQRVTGKVVDSNGAPIYGAVVMIKGTTTGVSTDAQGNYTINNVRQEATLAYSLMGYEGVEEVVGNRTRIDVTMAEEAVMMESVVAIGYGVKKKTDLTGSVGSIEADALVAKGATNVMEALQGQIPGVNITTNSSRAGGGFTMEIRGQNSIKGGSPLYVVDGIVVDNIDFLNPADLERVDVLKDASSNAIYGSRGSNGVVLVTTKQAKSAQADKVVVSYDGYYGMKQVARMPDFMDGDSFQAYRIAAYLARSTNATTNESVYSLSQNDFTIATINKNIWQRYVDKNYFDWISAGFQNSREQSHAVNLSGNSRNTSYSMGMTYLRDEGIFQNDNFRRVSIRGGFNSKIKNIATVGMQSTFSMTNNDRGPGNYISRALSMNPLALPYDADGNLVQYPASTIGLGNTSSGPQYTSGMNPMYDLMNIQNNRRNYYVLTNLFAEVEPVPGLKLKTQFSPMLRANRNGTYEGVDTDARRSAKTDRAQVTKNEYFEYTWDNYVTYGFSKGDHNFDATGVFSMYQSRNESTDTEVQDLSIPGFYNLASASTINFSKSDFKSSSMLSFLFRLNYDYKGKYLLTVSDRWDGSSKLPNKWQSFPSVAAGWRISEENFAKDLSWLTNLKLRLSWGYTGNNNIDPYESDALPNVKRWYGFGYSDRQLALGYAPNGISNQELTWEKTREVNVGLDFGVLRGRISGSIDYYNKLSDGLLMSRALPYEAGVYKSVMTANVGSVRNSGIEVGLTTINVSKPHVRWSTSFTYSKNKNEIVSLYGAKEDDVANRWFIGQPINVAYTYIWDGVVSAEDAKTDWAKTWKVYEGNGKVKDISGPNGTPDGLITSADRTVTGHANPDWIGNISSSLNVYDFDFGFNIYINQGRYVWSQFYNNVYDSGGGRSSYKLKLDYYLPQNPVLPALPAGWSQADIPVRPNTSGILPMPSANAGTMYKTDNADYQNGFADASFIKVKNITLGYTVPKKYSSKLMMSHLRAYVNVTNPFVFTDYKGYDPEWADALTGNPSTTTPGGTRVQYSAGGPATVVWQFGLNIKF